MGYVTMPLYELLRMNTHGYNLTNLGDLTAACKEMVFDNDAVNVIEQDYRDRFVLGFALHYFSDELGRETIPLFKMSVTEKLINNAEYINQVFDKLDKQVIGNYKTHRGQHADNNQELQDVIENGNQRENRTYIYLDNQRQEDETNRQSADNGSVINNEVHADSGNSSMSASSHGENDNESNSANLNSTEESNLRTGGGFTEINSTVGHTLSDSENNNNSISATLDTPQGSIVALRTPSGTSPQSLKGKGVDAEISAPYRYLTSGASTDSTGVSGSESLSDGSGTTQHIMDAQNNAVASRTSGSGATKSVGSNDNTSDETRQTASNGTQSSEQSHANTGVASEQSVSVHQSDRSDAGTKLAQDEKTSSSERKGSTSGNDQSEDYDYSNELIMRSLPYMKKIWNIFDRCFLGTYEIRGMF